MNKKISSVILLTFLLCLEGASAASVKATITASQTSVNSSMLKTSNNVSGTLTGKNNSNALNRGLYIEHYLQKHLYPDEKIAGGLVSSGGTINSKTTLKSGSNYVHLNPAGAATAGTTGYGQLSN